MNTILQIVTGCLRHVLTILGGAYVSKGLLTGEELTTGVAAIVTLIGVGWSIWNKMSIQKKIEAQGATMPEPEVIPGEEFNPKAEVRRAIENDKP